MNHWELKTTRMKPSQLKSDGKRDGMKKLSLFAFLIFASQSAQAISVKRCFQLEQLGRKQAAALMEQGGAFNQCGAAQDVALVIFDQLNDLQTIFPAEEDQSCWYIGALHGTQVSLEKGEQLCNETPAPNALKEECAAYAKTTLAPGCAAPALSRDQLLDLRQYAESSADPKACSAGIAEIMQGLIGGKFCG